MPKRDSRSDLLSNPLMSGFVFLLFVAIGCVYIIFSKLSGLPAWLVTVLPVLIMLGYAAVALLARALRLRDDQTGDNLYYMGFLFTLTSLGVSLFQFSVDGAAEEIVRNFGIAITSTIAGIALRVLFNQMRRDPIEVERASRLELAEAARRVRRELDATVVEMNHFRRAAQQSAREGFDEIASKLLTGLEDVTRRISGPLEQTSVTSAVTLETMTGTMTDTLDRSARKLSGESERMAAGAAKVTQALDDMTGRLSAMQTPDHIIKVELAPIVRQLSSIVKEHGKRAETEASNMREILADLREIHHTHERKVASLESALPLMERAAYAIEAATAKLDGVADQIAGHRQEIQAERRQLEADQKAFVEAREAGPVHTGEYVE